MTPKSKDTTGSAASVWDHEATSYDASRQTDPVYSSCTHQATNEIPRGTKRCLDAGCGTGLSTVAISPKCDLVFVVDYSINSLHMLKSKGLLNVIPVQADLKSLPFKDSIFDACVCANTLQHVSPNGPQERVIAELRRVTKEAGILSVSVHHYSRSKQRAGWKKDGKPGQAGIDYIFRFSRNDLKAVMPTSSIRSVGYYGFLKVPFLGGRLQNFLANFLGRLAGLLGYGHMLIAVVKNRKSYV